MGAKSKVTILDACLDDKLFGRWFKNPEDWKNWFVFLKSLFVLDMTASEFRIFQKFTKRTTPQKTPVREAYLVIGRRGGKSFILALIAVFLACFRDWTPFLTPGELGTIMVIAKDRYQARIIFRYINALVMMVPMIRNRVKHCTAESIELEGSVIIEVHAASFRGVRGYTIIAVLADEIAFWRTDDSANPDTEIIDALRPGMATIPDAILLGASSPYAKRGVLYGNWREYFGKNDEDILVWQAKSRQMNPTLSKRIVDKAYEKDPSSAAAEYGAKFRDDIETFVSPEAIDAVVSPGRFVIPPMNGITYKAFTDPSGGVKDAFALAIGHLEKGNKRILDFAKQIKPPFNPDATVEEFCNTLKEYRVSRVRGDRYGGEWPRESFRKQGVSYLVCQKPKSELYRDSLSIINSGQTELLDIPLLKNQFSSLERRTARGGRDSIDHPPGGNDDLANVVAGVLLELRGGMVRIEGSHYAVGTQMVSVVEGKTTKF